MRTNARKENRGDNLRGNGENPVILRNRKHISSPKEADQNKSSTRPSGETKSKLVKRVSWASDENLSEENEVDLTSDLKNIVVRVGNSSQDSAKRFVDVTLDRKSLAATGGACNQLTDFESERIKTSVAKTVKSDFVPVRLDYKKKKSVKLNANSENVQDFSSTVNAIPTVASRILRPNFKASVTASGRSAPVPKTSVPAAKPAVSATKPSVPVSRTSVPASRTPVPALKVPVSAVKTVSSVLKKEKEARHGGGERKMQDAVGKTTQKPVPACYQKSENKVGSCKAIDKEEENVSVDGDDDDEWEDVSSEEWEDVIE